MDHLETEGRNPASERLDELTTLDFARLMNIEDSRVLQAVGSQVEVIAEAIEVIADRLGNAGRLFYMGAGTSGRLGVLDASECPPTFSTPPELVVGLIAGGPQALTRAVEGAEDHPEYGAEDLRCHSLTNKDVVVGIATSGRTPYVLGGLRYAREIGAYTIGLACTSTAELRSEVDLAILPVVGPEILSGSTRLKAGTATKLVLNMLSTGAMVRLGKTFGNLMVDLRATNAKLRARTNRIVRQLTGLNLEQADALLTRCDGELKTALVAQMANLSADEARTRLQQADHQVRLALAPRIPPPDQTLTLGIDGGGTHTVALLARHGTIIGRGESGPSNRQAVGNAPAESAIDKAVAGAFTAAGETRCKVRKVVLGLAGAGRPADREWGRGLASKMGLACAVEVVSDVSLLLAAGTPERWGLALVAGTGSIAWGRTRDGKEQRAGGWGYLLGDEGSAYAVALAGLRAVLAAGDGRGPLTELSELLFAELKLTTLHDLVPLIYGEGLDRVGVARLAPVVIEVSNRDAVARTIVEDQSRQLSKAGLAVIRNLGLRDGFPLILAGGLLTGSKTYRELVVHHLRNEGVVPGPVAQVDEPACGAIRLAE